MARIALTIDTKYYEALIETKPVGLKKTAYANMLLCQALEEQAKKKERYNSLINAVCEVFPLDLPKTLHNYLLAHNVITEV